MGKITAFILYGLLIFTGLENCMAQEMVPAANQFIRLLDSGQKAAALYPFDVEERYNFHFIPKDNRKGITMGELNKEQKEAALKLVRSCLSEQAATKVSEIMQLDNVLKAIEHRAEADHYRDPEKYYFTIFGVPGDKNIWGWRLEGHHISFNFSVNEKKLVAGTPGFMGANPAMVKEGPAKGKQVLKDETDIGYMLLQTLTGDDLQKALINTVAPGEILTVANRKAMIATPAGIRYSEMNSRQQEKLLQLISLYIHRFTKLFADDMLKEIQGAGLDNLRFAWAGNTDPSVSGVASYYRVQGPTLIIEYDNSQNNANHIHTVVRDLKHDFGGDILLEHYRSTAH